MVKSRKTKAPSPKFYINQRVRVYRIIGLRHKFFAKKYKGREGHIVEIGGIDIRHGQKYRVLLSPNYALRDARIFYEGELEPAEEM